MKKQLGFGLVEVLVAVTLLSMATVAMIQFFALSNTNNSNITISLKNLQEQRYLERAIWANYDGHSNAASTCDINNFAQISLDTNNTCATGANGTVRAEKKELTRSSCVFESLNASTLSLSGCGPSLEILVNNINALPNKSSFKALIWAGNVNAATCWLANTNAPASVSGSSIQLQLNDECVVDLAAASNPTVRVPKLALNMLSRDSKNDGYQRLYY